MEYWDQGFGASLLVLAALIVAAGPLARRLPRVFPVPRSMIAGLLGFVLGPALLGWLPLEAARLEACVYHGLALVFIAVALQPGPEGRRRSGDAAVIGVGIALLTALQGAVGMLVVLGWSATGEELHPGFGFMAPLGFGQGPGQALALGHAWGAFGLRDGAGVGLAVAAGGFVSCAVLGALWLGRRPAGIELGGDEGRALDPPVSVAPEAIASAVFAIALVYLAAMALLLGAHRLLAGLPGLQAMLWGFHFLFGLGVALLVRRWWPRVPGGVALPGPALGAMAGLIVEFTTAAALAALSAEVLATWWRPIALLTVSAAGLTWVLCRLLERRAFRTLPFHHALLLFGTTTGTLLTGMALLRVVDPRLETPVAGNQILGSALAVPLTAPLVVGVMPLVVARWSPGSAGAALLGLTLLGAYALVLLTTLALMRRRAGAGDQNSMAKPT